MIRLQVVFRKKVNPVDLHLSVVHYGQMDFDRDGRTDVQCSVPEIGATNRAMPMVPKPPPDEEADDPIGITVRFPKSEYEDYGLIADLWNAVDEVNGLQRRHKWKPSSVLRHAARALRDDLRRQLEDWPKTKSDQEAFLRRVIADAKKEHDKKK